MIILISSWLLQRSFVRTVTLRVVVVCKFECVVFPLRIKLVTKIRACVARWERYCRLIQSRSLPVQCEFNRGVPIGIAIDINSGYLFDKVRNTKQS